MSAAGAAVGVPGPTTNLNIGMDYWGTTASSSIPAIRGKVPSASVAGGMVTAGSRESVQSQLWPQVFISSNIQLLLLFSFDYFDSFATCIFFLRWINVFNLIKFVQLLKKACRN